MSTCEKICDLPSESNEVKILLWKIKKEVETLVTDTEAKLLIHDGKIAELCKYIKDNLSNTIRCMLLDMDESGELDNLIVESIYGSELITAGTINILTLGAKEGIDCSDIIQCAIDNYKTIIIPKGEFRVTKELKLKPERTIKGIGASSVLVFENTSDKLKYCFKQEDSESPLYKTLIEDLTIKGSDVNRLIGGIKVDYAFRGNSIKNVWFNDISNPIYLGNKIWGIYSLDNIFAYYFPTDLTNQSKAIGIYGGSNTIYGTNIEICGSYQDGVKLENCNVASFINTNVSGSQSDYMKTAYHVVNCNDVNIDTCWIEQCVDENGTINTKAINVVDSRQVKIANIRLVTGSCYIDHSRDVELDNIRYYTFTSGLRILNNSYILSDKLSVGYCNFQNNQDYSMGQVTIKNVDNKSSVNLFNNPLFLKGIQEKVGESNANVIKTENTNDYYSGDRSFTINTPRYQGGLIDTTNILTPGKMYTIMAIVKPVSNVDSLYIIGNNMDVRTDFPSCFYKHQNESENDYNVIKATYTAKEGDTSIKIVATTKDDVNNAQFIIDSVFICEGKHSLDIPSGISKKSLLANSKVYAPVVPWAGTWEAGDVVYNDFTRDTSIEKWIYNGSSWTPINL